MTTTSQRVILHRGGDLYELGLTYKFTGYDVERGDLRLPTPGALEQIRWAENNLRNAEGILEQVKAKAWASGSPVTLDMLRAAQIGVEPGRSKAGEAPDV